MRSASAMRSIRESRAMWSSPCMTRLWLSPSTGEAMRFWLAPSYFFINRKAIRKSRVSQAVRKSGRASRTRETR